MGRTWGHRLTGTGCRRSPGQPRTSGNESTPHCSPVPHEPLRSGAYLVHRKLPGSLSPVPGVDTNRRVQVRELAETYARERPGPQRGGGREQAADTLRANGQRRSTTAISSSA